MTRSGPLICGSLGQVSDEVLAEGLYESVVTRALLDRLSRQQKIPEFGAIDEADLPDVLTRHLTKSLRRGFSAQRTPDDLLKLAYDLLDLLEATEESPTEPRQLRTLRRIPGPGVEPWTGLDRRPSIPLTEAALLTNAHGEPSVGSELRAELATCDGVDLLIAFVMWPGLRILEAELRELHDRGVPFRVVTTTYLGGTERAALDRLVRDFGAEVRVQYDARKTRLHAKAWLFHRNTGFDTGYVGSSNLSRAALLDGIEWNVRLSQAATPSLLDKFLGTFDAYWNSDQFEPYDPDKDRDRLDDALAEAKGASSGSVPTLLSGLQVRPYPYQQAILDAITAERTNHDRHRNLVVAATGTGKTVIAALDYASLCVDGRLPSLLFVAHRREILDQSRRTYREVLRDGNFGESYYDGSRPERWKHVFASVQSLSAYGVNNIPSDAFDVVVIDEFHHAEAPTYRRLLEHLQPVELLGLTATPERGDGSDVRLLFGGRTAAELRLWDAIDAGLLSPFHYFGISDNTDLSRVRWEHGRYDEGELSNLYTGNTARAALVLKQLGSKIIDPTRMRALGFCVSVDHAHYMADVFRRAGIPALAVSGETNHKDRAAAIDDLRAGRMAALFAADLFNEGLDIPEVDTVMFLRPTESPTIFLQQLGRGLRLAPDKDVLTVLDFVGSNRQEFRLDLRYRALTGATRRDIERQIARGFPQLPSGSQIVLDEVTQKAALDNVRLYVRLRWKQLVAELRAHPTDDLSKFLEESGTELWQVIKSKSWTQLRLDADLIKSQIDEPELALLRRVRALAHVDDRPRAEAYRRILGNPAGEGDLRYREMLFYSLWPTGGGFESPAAGLRMLTDFAHLRDDLTAVIELGFDSSRRAPRTSDGLELRLALHASYQREEILAALGYARLDRPPSVFREGVLNTIVDGRPFDAFLITLKKSDADYSPSTMYRDYPISPTLFHWESQSTTSVASPTGQRYLRGDSTVLLFVRREKENDLGTSPYVYLGSATYASHSGDRPIAITWRLATAIPAELYADTAIAAV